MTCSIDGMGYGVKCTTLIMYCVFAMLSMEGLRQRSTGCVEAATQMSIEKIKKKKPK
jgi:hypothetical protein